MPTLKFSTVPGITSLVVNMFTAAGASTGSTNNACTELASGLYSASVTGTGIVYVVASKGAFKATGWANFSKVVGGFVEVVATYADAAAETIDNTAIAAKVYQKLAGSSVALLSAPVVGDPIDAVLYADYSQRISVATAADSVLVLELRESLEASTAEISADSEDGLLTLLGEDAADPTQATVTRVDASNVDVWIAAAAFSQLALGTHHLELKELLANDHVESRYECSIVIRRSAARRIA